MSYETTLAEVRELSERALARPAPKHLRLTRPGGIQGVPRAIIAFEETLPIHIQGSQPPHQKATAKRLFRSTGTLSHCANCGGELRQMTRRGLDGETITFWRHFWGQGARCQLPQPISSAADEAA